jgi:hypothetical protein
MQKIIKENQEFVLLKTNNSDSEEIIQDIMKQKYKNELRSKFIKE